MKNKKNLLVNLSITLIFTTIPLYIIELYCIKLKVDGLDKNKVNYKYAKSNNLHFDDRSPIEIYKESVSKKERVSFYPYLRSLNETSFKGVVFSGISNAKTIFCNEEGKNTYYFSDEYGFNNPSKIHTKNQLDIIILGDSFTAGACASNGNNFADIVRKKYSETLNLGICGSGPLSEFAVFKEYALKHKPRVIIWNYFEGNDLIDLESELKNNILKKYYDIDNFSQMLPEKQDEIDQYLKNIHDQSVESNKLPTMYEYYKKSFYIYEFILLKNLRAKIKSIFKYGNTYVIKEYPVNYLFHILEKLQIISKTWDGKLIFVYHPSWERFINGSANAIDGGIAKSTKETILEKIKSNNIEYIDVTKIFESNNPLSNYVFGLNNHYNDKGHRLVGEELKRKISNIIKK